jgi:DMSO/TMAO reductase YedYZ molybdopterin-dependent catalytic subunit
MAEDNEPPDSKLTRTKQQWAREGRFLTGKAVRPEDQRLPPGQHLTKDWPVLDLGEQPVSRERWRLDVYGAVENPAVLDLCGLSGPEAEYLISDIHCVTTWSRYDNQWEGVSTRELLAACQPREARASWCCIPLTATPPTCAGSISPPRTRCSPIAGPVSR